MALWNCNGLHTLLDLLKEEVGLISHLFHNFVLDLAHYMSTGGRGPLAAKLAPATLSSFCVLLDQIGLCCPPSLALLPYRIGKEGAVRSR